MDARCTRGAFHRSGHAMSTSVLRLLLAICTVPAWTRSGWNGIRKAHFSLHALGYNALAALFVHRDLVLTSI